MSTPTPLYIGADHTLTLTGMSDGANYLNAATTKSWSLKLASTGAEVASGSLAYVAASNGNYSGELPSTETADLTEDTEYWIDITFVEGSFNDFRRLVRVAKYRRET